VTKGVKKASDHAVCQLGMSLRDLRKQRGMTLVEASAVADLPVSTLSSLATRGTRWARLPEASGTYPASTIYVDTIICGRSRQIADIPDLSGAMLACPLSGSVVIEQKRASGEWRTAPVVAGEFYLTALARGTEIWWHATSPDDAELMRMHISLPLLARAVRAMYDEPLSNFSLCEVRDKLDPILSGLVGLLQSAARKRTEGDHEFFRGVGQALAAHVVRHHGSRTSGLPIPSGGLQIHRLSRSIDMMRAALEEPFDLQTLARRVGLSAFHFSRVFKQATGMSPSRYFVHLRMQKARRLLCETGYSIIDIALELGYRSPSHFASVFRQVSGTTPSVYRDRALNGRRANGYGWYR
jgi:AraC family transcriptional regulator